jgi:hypothetical protein
MGVGSSLLWVIPSIGVNLANNIPASPVTMGERRLLLLLAVLALGALCAAAVAEGRADESAVGPFKGGQSTKPVSAKGAKNARAAPGAKPKKNKAKKNKTKKNRAAAAKKRAAARKRRAAAKKRRAQAAKRKRAAEARKRRQAARQRRAAKKRRIAARRKRAAAARKAKAAIKKQKRDVKAAQAAWKRQAKEAKARAKLDKKMAKLKAKKAKKDAKAAQKIARVGAGKSASKSKDELREHKENREGTCVRALAQTRLFSWVSPSHAAKKLAIKQITAALSQKTKIPPPVRRTQRGGNAERC